MAERAGFHLLSSDGDAPHGELAIALGAEFGRFDEGALDVALAPLVADLAPFAQREPADQLLAAEAVLTRHLRADPHDRCSAGLDDLLPHEVARRRVGHELAVTLVALEAARRAGLSLGLVAAPDAVYVAHPRLDAPVLLAPEPDGPWELLDARELGEPGLAWQCAHEAASLLLGLIIERTRRTGLLAAELRAAELCLALPVGEAERARLRWQLRVVRARLN